MQHSNTWASRFPKPLRRLIFADPGPELLRGIDTTLLVFGNRLLHVESGNAADLVPPERAEGAAADGSVPPLSAAALAECAGQLLTGKAEKSILLLPPAEFAATPFELPGIGGEHLRSALLLQLESILPALAEPVELAVHGGGAQVALWIASGRIDELHAAFAAKGLLLAAVKPRVLHDRTPPSGIIDDDGAALTFIQSPDGVLRQWKHLAAADLGQDEFATQWEAELRACGGAAAPRLESAADFAPVAGAEIHADYNFFPRAAVAECLRGHRRRQLLRASAALGVVALLAATPFFLQQFEIAGLNRELQALREQSAPARANREIVVDFENRWAAVENFPRQDARAAMFTLQQVLSPNRLSNLEISEGVIRIQGSSEDPQSILQRLEQNPMFTEVVFSRATSNGQYYIDLRLAEVNFGAYMARYFPDR